MSAIIYRRIFEKTIHGKILPAINAIPTMDHKRLKELAATYVWWSPPERVISENIERLVVSIIELGTWEDANELLAHVGRLAFLAVLRDPPPGIVSTKSLAFWHYRMGLEGQPPKARSRFDH